MSKELKVFLGFLAILVVGSLIAAYMEHRASLLPPASGQNPVVMELGGGWYAFPARGSLSALMEWERSMNRVGQDCRFMGISNTDTTGRNGGRISPSMTESLYLCRDQAASAQENTVP